MSNYSIVLYKAKGDKYLLKNTDMSCVRRRFSTTCILTVESIFQV